MLLNELGHPLLALLLPSYQLLIQFTATHLVNSHLVHLGQVLSQFTTEPFVQLHQVHVHLIDALESTSLKVLEIGRLHPGIGIQVGLILASEFIDLAEGFPHGHLDP